MKDTKGWLKGLSYIYLLTLLVLLFYWEVLGAYFSGDEPLEIWCALDIAHRYLYPDPEGWRPLSYKLNHVTYLGFGLNPLPYRLVSLALYISILPVLYHFYNQFFDDKTLSKIMLLLFATFYLHAEVVSQFVDYKELLYTFFGLATLIYLSYYRKTPCLRYYIPALLFGILASLFKEAFAVSLPLLLLAVDYHISHGVFPPQRPLLKDIRKNLLPHVPFWLLCLAVLSFTFMAPGESIVTYWTYTSALYGILNHSYFLAIYTFAPCYLTDRLTIILGLIIMGGMGWLFYRATPQRRSIIVTMAACTGFSLLPYIIAVPTPRYFFFSSVFSMSLVALLAFEIGTCAYRFLEPGLQRYPLPPDRTMASLALLILLPAIYLNYLDVRQYTKNYVYAGRLTKEIVKGTARILPQGRGESAIIYVNLPDTVESKAILSLDSHVAFNDGHAAALDLYYRQHDIPGMDFKWPENENIRAVYLDLGYNKVSLDRRAWYGLLKVPPFAIALSTEQFDTLSKDRKNRVLFFNPMTNKIVDASGWTYKELAESIAPYKIN